MIIRYWYLLTIYLISSVCFSQNSISGKVIQADSSIVPGTLVHLKGTQFGTLCNGKGEFYLENLPAGKFTLVSSCIGYITKEVEVELKENTSLEHLTIMIDENVVSLPNVTISGLSITGGNLGIKNLPPSAYYISPKELQLNGYTDINRIMKNVPGVNIQEEDGFGLRPNIGLRGTGVERNSKITVMEDGVLIAPAPYAAPAAYYFPTIGRMQAIEVLKGSSQIKYGPYTTGGAINLISTQIPEKFSGRVNVTSGSYGFKAVHSYIGDSYENFGYLVETFQYGSNGFKDIDGGDNSGFNKEDYMAKLRINTNKDANVYQSLSLKVLHTEESSNETYLGLSDTDFEQAPYRRYASSQKDNMKTKQQSAMLTHYLSTKNKLKLTTIAYHNEFERNWYKLNNLVDTGGNSISITSLLANPDSNPSMFNVLTGATNSINDNALKVRANNRAYYSQGVQSTLGYKFERQKTTHEVELSARIHRDEMDRYQWDDNYRMSNGIMQLTKNGTPGTQSNRIESAIAFASYLQYHLKFNKLSIDPGLRYENISIKRDDYGSSDPDRNGSNLQTRENLVSVFIPGIGVNYKFNKSLKSFAGVHKGFTPPGSTPEARPEESVNIEVGVDYQKESFQIKLVYFYNNYVNLLGTDLQATGGAGSGDLFNGGKALTQGVETYVCYDLLSNSSKKYRMPLTITYTYTDAIFRSNFESTFEDWGTVNKGDELPYLAHHQFSNNLLFETKKFNVSVGGRYIDKMRTVAGQGDFIDSESTDASYIMDISSTYFLSRGIGIFGSINNLTNQVYIVARRPYGVRPGMPRIFNIGIKANI